MAVEFLSWGIMSTRHRWAALDADSILAAPQSGVDYLNALARATGSMIESTFVVRDGTDIAGISSIISQTGPLLRIVPAPLTAFSAVAALTLPSASELHSRSSWLDELIKGLGQKYATVDIMLPHELNDVRVAQWQGWSASPLYTYTLPLKDSAPGNWSEGTRRTFKKNVSSYSLRSNAADMLSILDMNIDGYDRSDRTPPLPKPAVARMVTDLIDSGLAECWSVSKNEDGEPEAGVILLVNEKKAVYWVAGSKAGPAMTVLLGQLSKRLFDRGISEMDFVGANTPSIAEFKRRFDPVLDTYFRVRYTRNRFLRTIQSVIQSIR